MECLIAKMARQYSQRPYIVGSAGQVNYSEAEDAIAEYAQNLSNRLGSESQNLLVAFLAIPRPATLYLLHALLRQGFVAVPLNPKLPSVAIEKCLQQIGCKMFVQEPHGEVLSLKYADRELAPTGNKPAFNLNEKKPATLLFSSGSTDDPKAVVHSMWNHLSSAQGLRSAITLHAKHRWLLSLPLHHVSGLAILFRAAAVGASVAIPEKSEPLATAIRRYEVTHVSLVPFQLSDVLRDFSKYGVPKSLEALLVGGSSVSPQLLKEAHHSGLPLYVSYGLTEMASTIAVAKNQENAKALFGKPLRGSEWKMVDGEIWVRGKSLCMGYWREEYLIQAVNESGWLPTGDLGRVNSLGEVEIIGRKDNLFISGGENIVPEEIEKALLEITGVKRAFVCGVHHERYGKRPAALIDADPFPSFNEIQKNLRETLPKIKIPDFIFPWPRDEMERSFKMDRKRLKRVVKKKLNGLSEMLKEN